MSLLVGQCYSLNFLHEIKLCDWISSLLLRINQPLRQIRVMTVSGHQVLLKITSLLRDPWQGSSKAGQEG